MSSLRKFTFAISSPDEFLVLKLCKQYLNVTTFISYFLFSLISGKLLKTSDIMESLSVFSWWATNLWKTVRFFGPPWITSFFHRTLYKGAIWCYDESLSICHALTLRTKRLDAIKRAIILSHVHVVSQWPYNWYSYTISFLCLTSSSAIAERPRCRVG